MARKSIVAATFLLLGALWAAPAGATITPAPAIVSAFPTQSTGTVVLSLAFPTVRGGAGSSGLVFSGVPAGVTVVPVNPLSYSWIAGAGGASTSFRFAISAAATPGTYAVTITDQFSGPASAGTGSVTLVILAPSFSASPSPNPVTLTRGGSAQTVTVSTTVDPGFSFAITYSFSGFPAGVSTGGSQTTGSPYPARNFSFSSTITAPSGTFSGTLTGQYVNGSSGTVTKTFPMTVVLITPDIAASFASPTIALCNGGASVASSVTLSPVNGYTGTPTLTFTSIPAGITVSPVNPPASPMPPGQSVAFTVSASGAAAGPQSATLHIADPGAGISKNLTLNLTITNPDYTPSVAPPSVSVTAGGSSQTFTTTLSGNSCFAAASVAVTPSGQPAGVTFTPGSASLTGPGYTPVSLSVQAASGVAPGTYPVTFTFLPSSGPTRTASASLTISAAPDFTLSAAPNAASVTAGGSGSVTISASGLNGFSGSIDVTSPTLPGVTFSPAAFTVSPGGSRGVSIAVSATAAAATVSLNFAGTAAGISGIRSAPFTLTILPPPDFTLSVAPMSVSLSPGGAATTTVSNIALNGFAGTVSVTAPTLPNFTFSPSTFTLPAGGSRSVTLTASSLASPGPSTATFLATASGVTGTRSATLSINVTAAPDFSLSTAPASLTLTAGASGSVSLSATAFNGFTGSIAVAAPSHPDITLTPAAFTLTPGTSAAVTIGVSPSAAAATVTVAFTGTAAGIAGARTATLLLTILPVPDFSLSAAPASLSVAPGGSAVATVSSLALNGFTGTATVTAAAPPGLTFTPSAFLLAAGSSQPVTITAAPTAPAGPVAVAFSATAAGVMGSRTAILTVNVSAAPDFTLSAAPPSASTTPGGTASITVSASGFNGFSGAIDVASPTLANVTFSPASFTLSPGASRAVAVAVSPLAAPGTYPLQFRGSAAGVAGTRSIPFTLAIAAGPDFSLSAAPSSVSVSPGGFATTNVSNAALNGFAGTVSVTAPTMPDFTFTPSTFTLPAGASRSVTIAAAGLAPPGPVSAVFVATAPGVTGTRSATLAVSVTAAPDFSLSATPPALTLPAGASGSVTLSAAAFNGFAGSIAVTAPSLPNITFTPAAFTLTSEAPRTVTIQASAAAAPGSATAVFSGTGAGITGTRNAAVAITVTTTPPVITSVTPPGVATGVRSAVLRLGGRDFQAGGVTLTGHPGLLIESTRVFSPTLADVVVSARADASPGPARIDLRNPDGQTTRDGAIILVYPPEALGAPPGVTAIAIVFPRPGTIVSSSEALYPRALIATTGTGTVVGSWLFDGVPFDRFVATVAGGFPAQILTHAPLPSAFAGEHRLQIAIESPQRLVSPALAVILAVDRVSGLKLLGPRDGAVTDHVPPTFRWTPVPGANGYELELKKEAAPLPVRRRVANPEWTPGRRDLGEIGPGTHRWRVRAIFPGEVPGEPTLWQRVEISFDLSAVPPAEREKREAGTASARLYGGEEGSGEEAILEFGEQLVPAAAASEAPASRTDWAVVALGTPTFIEGSAEDQRDDVRLQLSAQGDLADSTRSTQFAGDISFKRQFDEPNHTIQESRNWLVRAGAEQGGFREEGVVGFAAPSFLDQSQLLTSGLVRGSAEGKLLSPVGSLAYYESFDSALGGAVAGNFGPQQKIRAGAFQAAGDVGRFLFRVIAMEVDDQPSPYSSGGKGEAYGLFGKITVSPLLTALLEVARGEFRSVGEDPQAKREGYGYWLGLAGATGGFAYTMNLRNIEEGFVNPANRGLTAGGVPDHLGGDLSLTQVLGRASVALQYRHVQRGLSGESGAPTLRQDTGNLTVNTSLGSRISLSASGNLVRDRGEEDFARFLPRSDRVQAGWTLTASETPGRITFSESFSFSQLRDKIHPSTDQEIRTASVTAGGMLLTNFNLTALISGSRSEGTVTVGRTEQTLVSLQPSLAIPSLFLSLQPRATYARSKNDLTNFDNRLEQYGALLHIAPRWSNSLLSLQLSGDWIRSRNRGQPDASDFLHKYAATFTLRWGAGHGPAAPSETILPGVTPIAPPVQGGANPVPGSAPFPGGGL